jgi:hypothetical protein
VLPERGGGAWTPSVVQSLAPRATNWMRAARFDYLPPSADRVTNGADGREHIVIFHKVPSLAGRHFGVNRFTATLLEDCDGRRSVARIVGDYAAASGREPAQVARAVITTLRRFYREGLIIFVDPTDPTDPSDGAVPADSTRPTDPINPAAG